MDKEIILKPKEDTTTTFSIRVNKDLLKEFDTLSTKSGYSRNELINIAMKEYIKSVRFVPDDESNKIE